jgi:glutamate-1-semialdehyde 2,1-aminomutase
MLKYLEEHPEIYDQLEASTAELAKNAPAGACVNRVGSMITFFFQEGPVRNYREAKRSDAPMFGRFFHHLLERGVYFPPSQFEAAFVSAAHTEQDVGETIRAFREFAAA